MAAVGDGSDDEGWEGEPETVEQRLARLRREVDELRVQIGKKKKAQEEEGGEDVGRGLEELAEALGGLVPDEGGAQERLARKLVGSLGASVQVRKEIPPAAAGGEEVCFSQSVMEGGC